MSDDEDEGGSFEERLRAARARQAAARAAPPAEHGRHGRAPMGIGVRVGVELVSALAVGLAIGWGLDWLAGDASPGCWRCSCCWAARPGWRMCGG